MPNLKNIRDAFRPCAQRVKNVAFSLSFLSQMKTENLVAGAIEGLLVGVLEGEGGGGAVLPRLGAEVVVEAGAGGHGLGVEVGREGAILFQKVT